MIRISSLFLFFLLPFLTTAQTLRVASFNLRYANSHDTGNLWEDRRSAVTELIRFHEFDVFGTQEVLKRQLDDIKTALPEYNYYGKGRDDGKEAGEHSAIFYRKDQFKLLSQGDFWLSETPNKPGLGWDATCCNRICSWVHLEDIRTKKKFYFFNAHFDHEGVIARVESSKLILKKIKEIAGNNPTVFTGDLNGGHQSDWYLTLKNSGLLKDTYTQVNHPYALSGSFNDFGEGNALQRKEIIDHIFVTNKFRVQKWGLLTDTYKGRFPSDHFPVLSVIKIQ